MWGSDVPMAIIDGEVYKEGDVIISNGAKLYKIENNEVLIYYDGRLHKRKVGVQPEKGDNL
jgi:type II secretory pathway component PulC